jgi:acetyltransferase-like isoleucine patch superfamily enzyme
MMTEATVNTVVATGNQPPKADPLHFLSRILIKLYSIWVSLTYPFAAKARNLLIHHTCDLSRRKAHRIKLGKSIVIMKDARIDVDAPPDQDGEPLIVIDDNVGIGPCCHISAKNRVHLEGDLIIAQSVLISDHTRASGDGTAPNSEPGATEGGRIRIGQGSWIGRGAAIVCDRGEVVLGRNCVVAANALVTRSFPPYSIIVGNPAGVIRRFDLEKNAWVIGFGRPTQTSDTSQSRQSSAALAQS